LPANRKPSISVAALRVYCYLLEELVGVALEHAAQVAA